MSVLGADRLLFGYHMPSLSFPSVGSDALFERIAANVEAAEAAGFDLVTVMDHFYQIPPVGPEDEPMLEGFSTLAGLAARTTRVRLGTMVAGVTYRNPALLAKTVTTLDVISGGRAVLGLGAAWFEGEHTAYGFDFPPLKERFERLEEALQICLQMWSDDNGPYEGRHYQLAETLNRPGPLGRIPILIGGTGERKTLRLVARYADACNLFASSPEEVAHKLDVMRGHCEAEDRDYDSIGKTMMMSTSTEDPDTFLAALAPYRDLGIDTVYTAAKDDPVAFAERFATGFAPRLADF